MLFHEQKWTFSSPLRPLHHQLLEIFMKFSSLAVWYSLFGVAIEKDYREWCIEILSNGKLMAKAISVRFQKIMSCCEASDSLLRWETTGVESNKSRWNEEKSATKTTSTCFAFERECQLFIERLHVSINYFKHSRESNSIDGGLRPIIIETNKLTFHENVL